jgi:hypothetical protein
VHTAEERAMARYAEEERNAVERQQQVFAEACVIYEDRYKTRGDLWASPEFEQPENLIHHLENKLARAKVALRDRIADSTAAEVEDSLLDLLNYTAFMIRWRRGVN